MLLKSFEICFKKSQYLLRLNYVQTCSSAACNKTFLLPDDPSSLVDKTPSFVQRIVFGRHRAPYRPACRNRPTLPTSPRPER